jgi:type VI secretion system protein ImpI
MDIMFEIVSRQRFSASFPTSHVFGEAGGSIGRSDECEWVLPDRSKHISRKHALITFDDGDFYLEDVSANGVFFSLGNEPVGRGRRRKIEHGDGFIIGGYTIMARLLHDPKAYAASRRAPHDDVLTFSRSLSLNPLTAMDEEEEMIARQRLGDFNDLLGHVKPQPVLPSDHSDPRISTLQPITAIPERQELVPADWDGEPNDGLPTAPVQPPMQTLSVASPPVSQKGTAAGNREIVSVSETDVFFKALGFPEPPTSPEECERILVLAAHLLVVAVDGMTRALQNRNEAKNELRLSVTTTGLGLSNNPLKFSPTVEAALAALLGPPQKGVLPPVESMLEGFDNLHSHHMGLVAGARAAVRACLERVSPQAVEARLDADGPVRLGRTGRLWHTFIRMHHALRDDHEGFAALFLQDFARAYEVQGRTLRPSPFKNESQRYQGE